VEFTPAALDTVLRSTRRSVKAALLDQRGVAGVGNIYADEACFLAGVRPSRRCPGLTRRERAALHQAIVAVLEKAVSRRGSSVDDYRDIWDARGSMQEELLAYGRAGQPSLRCGHPALRRSIVAGRGTSWCPGCQR
jgi:formamidopyrimidine-DNA glycosylase